MKNPYLLQEMEMYDIAHFEIDKIFLTMHSVTLTFHCFLLNHLHLWSLLLLVFMFILLVSINVSPSSVIAYIQTLWYP